jgi:hypothetical protein
MSEWTIFKELVRRLVWSRTAFYVVAILVTTLIVGLLVYGQFFSGG